VLTAVRQRLAQHGHPPVYLSLDIDCLDPAFAPGTGTPEPGGLSTNQVLTLLEEWADLPFVGMDCVEVAPPLRPRRTQQPGRRRAGLDLPLRAGGAAPAAALIRRKSPVSVTPRIATIIRSKP
jgi:hypothetical protein